MTLLVKNGLINNYADLYDLTIDQILPLDRMAEKSAYNLIAGVEASKKIVFDNLYTGYEAEINRNPLESVHNWWGAK